MPVPDTDVLDRPRLHGGDSEVPHGGEAKGGEVEGLQGCAARSYCGDERGPFLGPSMTLPVTIPAQPTPTQDIQDTLKPRASGSSPQEARGSLGPAQLSVSPPLSSPGQLGPQPGLQCIQRAIERHVIPLPGADLVVADVGKAVDDVGAQGVVDVIRDTASIAFPVLGPAGVVADQLVRRA